MIRILDRYVLAVFLSAVAVFTISFATLFLVLDLASKLSNFLALKNVSTLAFIGRYYVVRLPLILTYLAPTVLLFAAIFTLIKLARANEILPMIASGTSLRRIAGPFLAAALFAGAGMAAMEEFVLPPLGDAIVDTDELVDNQETTYRISAYDGRVFVYALSYDQVGRRMRNLRVTILDDEMRRQEVAVAAEGAWDPGRRRFIARGGTVEYPQERVANGGRPETRRVTIPPEGWEFPATIGPESLRRNSSFASRFPFSTLANLEQKARAHPHIPVFRVRIHARFAFALSPLVLLLLGLPFVASAPGKTFLSGMFLCFLLALAYYMTYFVLQDLGNRGDLPAAWAAWTPTGLFGGIGLVSFARMRT
jgi:lipopolysaccharide export LptBFGC system permease protein LptF